MNCGASLCHLVCPAPIGGLETVVAALATGRAALGRPTAAILVDDGSGGAGALAERLAPAGVRCETVPAGGRAYLRERRAITRAAERLGAALVHTHGYRADVLGGAAARSAGCAVVTTLHGFTGGDWKNRVYEWLQVRAARRADAVIAVSVPIRERLRRAGVATARLHDVPNALRPAGYALPAADARAALRLGDPAPCLGWVGRVSREKGLDVLIRALPSLPDVALVVVGDGPERASCERLASELGVGGRVRFVGRVPDAARLLRAFDLLVLSSRTEGTPMVALEAMAAGVPVVATAVGGVPDLLGPDAALVAPERPDALARAIAPLIADPERRTALAEHAARRLAERADPAAWLARHESIYAAALAARPRSTS